VLFPIWKSDGQFCRLDWKSALLGYDSEDCQYPICRMRSPRETSMLMSPGKMVGSFVMTLLLGRLSWGSLELVQVGFLQVGAALTGGGSGSLTW
jgi:hypothetical protein